MTPAMTSERGGAAVSDARTGGRVPVTTQIAGKSRGGELHRFRILRSHIDRHNAPVLRKREGVRVSIAVK